MKLSNDRRIRLKNTVVSDLIEKSRVINQEKNFTSTNISLF